MGTTSWTHSTSCAHVFCTGLNFGQSSARTSSLSFQNGCRGKQVLSSTKMGRLPFKRCQGSLGIEEAEQGFCAIQSLVFSCPSTELFLIDLKHFQNEWAKFPGTVTCQAFSLAAKSLSALQTMFSIQDGSPLLLQNGSQWHVRLEGLVSKRPCFSILLTPPSCQRRVCFSSEYKGRWLPVLSVKGKESKSHLCT